MTKIRLVTFNTFGLKFIAKHRRERLCAIAEKLGSLGENYDIVALQEVWCEADWDYICLQTSNAFPHRRIFYSGIITGPGLAVLSKYPITSTFLYRFPINGRPSAFFRGDWYVGKSVAVTILKVGDCSKPVALMNTHMHAPYASKGDAAYACHRVCQAWDFSKIAKLLSQAGYAVIFVGDLNSVPGSLPHRVFEIEASLSDSWQLLKGSVPSNELSKMDPQDQIEKGGVTCDSQINTFRLDRRLSDAKRLDYAFIDAKSLQPTDASVEFTEVSPRFGSFSDHFAYHVDVSVTSEVGQVGGATLDEKFLLYNDMLATLKDYESTMDWQRNWRVVHFVGSLVFVVGAFVAVPFASRSAFWASEVFMVVTVIVAVTGVVNGLIVLLFGKSERRAMREVEMEVRDAKNSLH